jgi:membrane protein implicated in regulation of membrane protease activity
MEESNRNGIYKIISAVVAIVAVVLFILTEDLRNPMIMTDNWTLIMILLALVSVVTLFLGRRFHKESDQQEPTMQG